MKQLRLLLFMLILCAMSCSKQKATKEDSSDEKSKPLQLTISEAQKIIELPLHCLEVEYPNKLGQVLNSDEELKSPKQLRPIFYGCFDWHSSAHGYWSVVKLVKQFPELDENRKIDQLLTSVFTSENVAIEKIFL